MQSIHSLQEHKTNKPSALAVIADNKSAIKTFVGMIAAANSQESMPSNEAQLMIEALSRFKITHEEAQQAFWEAYGDPYKSGNKIQFCHIWKAVKEMREKRPENQKLWVYEEALAEAAKSFVNINDLFVCLNGDNGTERILHANGKPAWIRRV